MLQDAKHADGLLVCCKLFRRSMFIWKRGGSEFGDIAFWMNDFLTSDRFRDAFMNSGLKGLSRFIGVTVLSHRSHGALEAAPPIYFRTIPHVGSAQVDVTASEVEWREDERPKCSTCLLGGGAIESWRRVVVNEETWNGDDIFYSYGIPGVLLVSSRFYDWAEGLNFQNLYMFPSEEYGKNFVGKSRR